MKNIFKNSLSLLLVFLMTLSVLVPVLSPFAIKASAASYMPGFPLDITKVNNGEKYNINALGRYPKGSKHKSYIMQYVLNKSYDYCDFVIDIGAEIGTAIYAVANGTVMTNTYSDSGGYYVVLSHSVMK